ERLREALRDDVPLAELDAILATAAGEQRAWRELHAAIGQRRSVVDTERRRLEAAQTSLSVDQAMAFVSTLAHSVKTHVADRKAIEAINRDIAWVLRIQRLPERVEESETTP